MRTLVRLALGLTLLVWSGAGALSQSSADTNRFVQFVFTSDAHYGITRESFRGRFDVDAHTVNTAMIARINALPATTFPNDEGLRSGEAIGAVDFVAQGGDIANREEGTGPDTIQPAQRSWAEFETDYIGGLTIRNRSGGKAPLVIVPGNHDASNAVGFHKRMTPVTDSTALVEIYNRMMSPAVPKTKATFDYGADRVHYSRDVGGVRFVFLQVWPDSAARTWMDENLRSVGDRTPVVIIVHEQPDVESKHFVNPNGAHDVNPVDKFENLLSDTFADGSTTNAPSRLEQAALESFLDRHPSIVAYFHGHSNRNEFYEWTGPGRKVTLHTFRVDSPMKGALSAADETALSFQVVVIDTAWLRMTVRECLWNRPTNGQTVSWGAGTTVSLSPRR